MNKEILVSRDYYMQLGEERDDLQDRIDKAIDYIRQYDGHISGYYYSKEAKRFLVENNVKNELLDILKGSDKE